MLKIASSDIINGLRRADLWLFLGWHDVRQRYRRSILGPFWITIASAFFIGFMTLVYSSLFRQDIATFMPLAATGLIIWGFISGSLVEGASVFIASSATIKQIPAPLPLHVFRLIWQQVIFLLHNATVIVLVMIIAKVHVTWATLLVIPGLLLVTLNLTWMVLFIGSLGARFRDVPVIVGTFMPALFLGTPVFWQVSFLPPDRRWVAFVNPFTYLLEIVRIPVLGTAPSIGLWSVCIAMTVVGWIIALFYYSRARGQLAYWI
ncbi:ABC transporter permease [Microvirga pudoricolor]|uniref:ABC transporter permease n=1 Tax=Microvirga pudoricolor TaxID=2778729 RepID=UPI00195151EE|nr:ABC transporter permease [Microvirga pudoricolor]MBM6596241.1 ABC transporter permease [Microvirga pudoricolor]